MPHRSSPPNQRMFRRGKLIGCQCLHLPSRENQRLFLWAWCNKWPCWRIHMTKGQEGPRDCEGSLQVIARKSWSSWAVEFWPWPQWASKIPSWTFGWEHSLAVILQPREILRREPCPVSSGLLTETMRSHTCGFNPPAYGHFLWRSIKQIHWVLTSSYSAIPTSTQIGNITITLESFHIQYRRQSLPSSYSPPRQKLFWCFLHYRLILSALKFHVKRILLCALFFCLTSFSQHNVNSFCNLSVVGSFCGCILFCSVTISQFLKPFFCWWTQGQLMVLGDYAVNTFWIIFSLWMNMFLRYPVVKLLSHRIGLWLVL